MESRSPAPILLSCALLATLPRGAEASEGPRGAASELARDLAEGMAAALGERVELVMLTDLETPPDDAVAQELAAALARALVNEQGIALVDRESLRAALGESGLAQAAGAAALKEVAGAFGAALLVTGSVQRAGETRRVDLRAVQVRDGAVIATARASFGQASDDGDPEARTLEVQLRRLADRIAIGLDGMTGELRYQRVAVMPFQDNGEGAEDRRLGLLVAAEITTVLRRDHRMMLVERSALTRVIEELGLGQTGLTDPETTVEAGKLAGAQGLVIGSVTEAGDRFLVHARVVSVADGHVELAEEAKLPAADLVALSSEAVVLRTRGGAVYRSLLLPGWGQLYNRQPVKSGLFAGAEVLAAGLAVGFQVMGAQYHDRYAAKPASTPQEKLDDLIAKEEASYQRRNWAIAAVIAIHVANVLDAFFSGKTFDPAVVDEGGAATLLRF